jgi:aspartyl-tRNA(Asn)/glutamyl-tRNA(Gln) amidotransferase subunit A
MALARTITGKEYRGMKLLTARDRLEAALAKIDDPSGEGARTCLTVYRDAARAAADASEVRDHAGTSLGPLDGAIVTLKDLFDVAGEVTRAGSKVLADEGKPATADAPVVQRLRAAGGVIVAKTNMSEFAFTGIGINPHFGTPGNPADRARAPGGSSSGAAVAAADGMCEIAIGSDTGGSCRIPAALCGVVGFKPSRQRIPTEGAFPLSYSLDSIGSLARSVAGCANADAVIAGEAPWLLEPASLSGLRLGVAQGLALENLDGTVGKRFPAALERLGKAGARLSDETLPQIDDMMRVLSRASILVAEVYSIHRERLARRGADIDQIVRARVEKGRDISSADYIQVVRERAGLIRAMDARLADLDVLIMPTCPTVAPRIDEVSEPKAFMARNALLLCNTTIGNFFDLCAISLPLPRAGGLPTGLMLVARNGHDQRLFQIATAVERLLAA